MRTFGVGVIGCGAVWAHHRGALARTERVKCRRVLTPTPSARVRPRKPAAPRRRLATLDLMRLGKLRIAPLITHRFPAERIGAAYELLNTPRASYLGLAIAWQ